MISKNSTSTRLGSILCMLLAWPLTVLGQTPTHIDPGTSDDSVHISDDYGYVILIVSLILVLVIWLLIMRNRNIKRRKRNR